MFLFYIKISDHGKKKKKKKERKKERKKEIYVRQNEGSFFYSAQNDPVNKLKSLPKRNFNRTKFKHCWKRVPE